MCSQGARAASVLSTQSCFTNFEKYYHVFNSLDDLKGPLLVYTNHINNHMSLKCLGKERKHIFQILFYFLFFIKWIQKTFTEVSLLKLLTDIQQENKNTIDANCRVSSMSNLKHTFVLHESTS